jgi:hypothetical protein
MWTTKFHTHSKQQESFRPKKVIIGRDIAARLLFRRTGFESWSRPDIFYFPKCQGWLWGLWSLLFNGYRTFLTGVDRLWVLATHLLVVQRLKWLTLHLCFSQYFFIELSWKSQPYYLFIGQATAILVTIEAVWTELWIPVEVNTCLADFVRLEFYVAIMFPCTKWMACLGFEPGYLGCSVIKLLIE